LFTDTQISRSAFIERDEEKVFAYAKGLATFDFDRFMIEDVICSHGYSAEEAEKLAARAINSLPKGYPKSPPVCFSEVKDHVLNSLKNHDIESLKFYFAQYSGPKYKDIINRIIKTRESGEEGCFDNILESIKPLVEGLLTDNYALVFRPKDRENVDEIKKKENLELELFGVWTIDLMNRRQRIIEADNKIMKISKG
jgi:hypothetical protein